MNARGLTNLYRKLRNCRCIEVPKSQALRREMVCAEGISSISDITTSVFVFVGSVLMRERISSVMASRVLLSTSHASSLPCNGYPGKLVTPDKHTSTSSKKCNSLAINNLAVESREPPAFRSKICVLRQAGKRSVRLYNEEKIHDGV